MRKILPILLCFLLATANSAVAQKKRKPTSNTVAPSITLREAIKSYQFDIAENLLLEEIESLRDRSLSTEKAEKELHEVERAKSRLNATEQVVFIDSLVVPRDELFAHLTLSKEIGSIIPSINYFGTDTIVSSAYTTQMKDKIYYADIVDNEGHFRLFSKDMEGNTWSEPSQLPGLDEQGDEHQSFPFMLSDGITLYYAAKGPESIGGYDIFMTRYDADNHAFLTPENIGMPFNSPANDYLYIVDDYNNIGWFVTDRNQPEGSVCIYVFIPNETRKVYNTAAISAEQLRSYAQINSIKATWDQKEEVDNALARVEAIKKENSSNSKIQPSFVFILNDSRICKSKNDLKTEEGKKLYDWWLEGQKQKADQEQALETLRTQYEKANANARKELQQKLINAENSLKTIKKSLLEQEKNLRKAELK